MSKSTESTVNICLECECCCDGTIVGFVSLDDTEIDRVKNLKPDDTIEQGFFLTPCNSLCDGCTIYERRPHQCATFECGLLKSVDTGKTTVSNAMDIVEKVKKQRDAIKGQLAYYPQLKSSSFYFRILEIKKMSKKDSTFDNLPLLAAIDELDKLISEHYGLSLD